MLEKNVPAPHYEMLDLNKRSMIQKYKNSLSMSFSKSKRNDLLINN